MLRRTGEINHPLFLIRLLFVTLTIAHRIKFIYSPEDWIDLSATATPTEVSGLNSHHGDL